MKKINEDTRDFIKNRVEMLCGGIKLSGSTGTTTSGLTLNLCLFDLHQNHLATDGMNNFIHFFKWQNINEINFSSNKLGDDSCRQLEAAFNASWLPHLFSIDLSNNQITDTGAKHLGVSLSKGEMSNLKVLRLENNQITDEGYGFLVGTLKSIDQCISIVFKKILGLSKEAFKTIIDGMLSIAQKNGISTKEILTTDETIEHCKKGTYNIVQNIAVGATTCTTPIGTVVDIYELNTSSLCF